MSFLKNHTRLFAGLFCVFIALAVLFTGGYQIADAYRSDLDSRLGTSSSVTTGEEGEARYQSDYEKAADFVTHMQDIAERIEAEGAVLLKNENGALPMETSGNGITLFGIHSDSNRFRYGGSVNAESPTAQQVGIDEAFEENGFSVNPELVSFYSSMTSSYSKGSASGTYGGASVNEVPQNEYSALSGDYTGYDDAAIVILGRDSGEGLDYYPGEDGLLNPDEFTQSATGNIFSLSDDERDLIAYVEEQGFDRIIVLLNTTSTMEIQELKEDEGVDAIMWVGNPGPYGITSIAQIINGTISPSGSLADTYAVNTAMAPSAQNYGVFTYSNYTEIDSTAAAGTYSLTNSWYYAELEGIYTGYKYYETRYYDSVVNAASSNAASTAGSSSSGGWEYDSEVSYPFGYGLSYSTFEEEITDISVDLTGDTTVTVDVTNTGSVAAKHTVQLYVSLPWEEGQVEKSAIQLIGYGKTGDEKEAEAGYDFSATALENQVLLASGDTETVTITVPSTYFASYDEDEGDGAFVLDSGDYCFALGNGAHDALQNVLIAQGYLDGDADGLVEVYENTEDIVIDESESGAEIENRLETADLNNYEGVSVTYLSRSDWKNTFPSTLDDLAATDEMVEVGLKNYLYDSSDYDTGSLSDRTFGTDGVSGDSIVTLIGLDYDDEQFDSVISAVPLADMVSQTKKGFQLISSIEEISMPEVNANGTTNGIGAKMGKYTSGTDYEVKGTAANIDCRVFPLESVVASTFSHRVAEIQGVTVGNQSLWTGLNWWYGVGSNLHRSPYNARNHDYYSEDSILSGTMTMDVCEGTQPYGVLTGVKHFAFNTMESHRTGVSTYFNEQSARENELRSFELAIKSGSVDGIMSAYNRLGPVYSSANYEFITGLLREEWGYNGIVITDLVQSTSYYVMPAEILSAGSDLIMSSSDSWTSFTTSTVSSDKYLSNAIYEAWHHMLYSIANCNALNTATEDTSVVRAYPWWEVTIITGIVVCWVLVAGALALTVAGAVAEKKKGKGVQ